MCALDTCQGGLGTRASGVWGSCQSPWGCVCCPWMPHAFAVQAPHQPTCFPCPAGPAERAGLLTASPGAWPRLRGALVLPLCRRARVSAPGGHQHAAPPATGPLPHTSTTSSRWADSGALSAPDAGPSQPATAQGHAAAGRRTGGCSRSVSVASGLYQATQVHLGCDS